MVKERSLSETATLAYIDWCAILLQDPEGYPGNTGAGAQSEAETAIVTPCRATRSESAAAVLGRSWCEAPDTWSTCHEHGHRAMQEDMDGYRVLIMIKLHVCLYLSLGHANRWLASGQTNDWVQQAKIQRAQHPATTTTMKLVYCIYSCSLFPWQHHLLFNSHSLPLSSESPALTNWVVVSLPLSLHVSLLHTCMSSVVLQQNTRIYTCCMYKNIQYTVRFSFMGLQLQMYTDSCSSLFFICSSHSSLLQSVPTRCWCRAFRAQWRSRHCSIAHWHETQTPQLSHSHLAISMWGHMGQALFCSRFL